MVPVGVLEAYGRDELNSNGKRLLAFVSDSDSKLALTNTRFCAREGGIYQYMGKSADAEGVRTRGCAGYLSWSSQTKLQWQHHYSK